MAALDLLKTSLPGSRYAPLGLAAFRSYVSWLQRVGGGLAAVDWAASAVCLFRRSVLRIDGASHAVVQLGGMCVAPAKRRSGIGRLLGGYIRQRSGRTANFSAFALAGSRGHMHLLADGFREVARWQRGVIRVQAERLERFGTGRPATIGPVGPHHIWPPEEMTILAGVGLFGPEWFKFSTPTASCFLAGSGERLRCIGAVSMVDAGRKIAAFVPEDITSDKEGVTCEFDLPASGGPLREVRTIVFLATPGIQAALVGRIGALPLIDTF